MSKRYGKRHKLFGIVTSKAKHHTLVTGTVKVIFILLAAFELERLINTHSDIGALCMYRADNGTGRCFKAVFTARITYLRNGISYDPLNVNACLSGDLTHNVYNTRSCKGFASNTAIRILLKHCIQDGIGNLVTNFVGVSFGYRLGRKEVFAHIFLLLAYHRKSLGGTNPPRLRKTLICQDLAPYFSKVGCRASQGQSLRRS
jgi:hypothetical protein